jgi:alginate O-acetyltransferase complex protein AlgI
MVGLRLPINFNSPYLATSIIAFWRRWHITLSHWLRDYLFIPLGGSRHGFTRHILSLLITMLIGGLWHGAAWTFVIWGGLHGALLLIAHAWRHLSLPRIATPLSWLLTFINVMALWILFRAPDLTTAYHLYGSLLGNWSIDGLHGQSAYTILFDAVAGRTSGLVLWIPVALTIALLPCNSNDLANLDIAKSSPHHWGLTLFQGLMAGALVTICLRTLLQQPSTEFLYFAF